MQVFGIVGWKNNGKTTLVERLISQLTLMGYKVSSVKHAHHDVDIDEPGRDSYRHRAAGAVETLLATEKRWALMHEYRNQEVPKLAQLLDVFEPCDIVIVEGYKNADHPKLEVVRNLNKGGFLADKMSNIVAIATDKKNLDITLPQLDINNIQQVAEFVIQHTGLMAKPAEPTIASNDCYSPDQQLLPASLVWQRMQQAVSTQVSYETLAIDECINRRLAQDVITSYDSPRFNNAAVDGYAFNYQDLATAKNLTLPLMTAEANAGGSAKISLESGHCIRVLTGARMPLGANTVVMQENVSTTKHSVTLPNDCKAGANWPLKVKTLRLATLLFLKASKYAPKILASLQQLATPNLRFTTPLKWRSFLRATKSLN